MKNNQDLEKEYQELKRKIRLYNDGADFMLIDKAWEFAKLAHHGQMRASGEPYAIHSLKTAEKLAEWKLDTTSVVVGLLHDTVEKGGATKEDVRKEFGEKLEKLVDGVTEISKLELKGSDEELFVENLRKMFFAMTRDIRVVIIRLAERYHNMETLSFMAKDHQARTAKETIEIFAPLAERLGMGGVKTRLEDLSFPYLHPDEYKSLVKQSKAYYKKAGLVVNKMKKSLLSGLAKHGIRAKVQCREKNLYSLWKKLQRSDIKNDLDKIHDIVAVRVLVDTVDECYTALGVVHELYKPHAHIGISDFIAKPKPNGYRSIHTKVIGPEDRTVEVQIRTIEMHEENEFGVAAHWHLGLLKSKGKLSSKQIDEGRFAVERDKLIWVKELAKWQKEIVDSEEFLKAVRFDALSERIYVFSPNGDVFDLPTLATPVDFAYTVHTGLGNYIKRVKVNGKLVALDKKLKNGDVVEIVKSKDIKKPSHSWIDFVATTVAKRKIKQRLRIESQKS